jgi:hypothetical protein
VTPGLKEILHFTDVRGI